MKKLLALLFSLFLLNSPSVYAETVLYCQSELATGLAKVNGIWKVGNFDNKRFTIKFNDDLSRIEGGLPSSSPMECDNPFNAVPNVLHCVSPNLNRSTMRYDIKTKKFVFYFNPSRGYVTGNSDTDLLYAGTCEIF